MSVDALAGTRPGPGPAWSRRLALALAAIAAVAGLVALAGYGLAGAVPPPKAPHPFGMGLREAAPAASGVAALLLSWQSAFFNALRGMLTSIRDGGGGAWALLGIGFAYGVFHAAGPGHGKAIISAYIVSSERALLRGVGVSVAAALIQALVAIALVGIVFLLVGGTAATMSRTANAVEIAGFALVAALGAYLVWRKAGALAILLPGQGAGPAAAASRAAAFDPTCSCGPIDPGRSGTTLAQMAGVALGAGIRPCAGAIVVLTLARSYGIFPIGIAATLAMALGTALTTGALASLSVYAKRLALRYAGGRGETTAWLGAAAELIAAAFVLVIGLALLAGLWDGIGGT